jgi:tRNA U34 5-methylaminomethyl-2-thiouridine-forming methyltransferase MnmC
MRNFAIQMKREIVLTKDGSKTIHLPDWNENYHSHHGAVQEALHVFIQSGLDFISSSRKELSILEVGFGTGLNAILTYIYGVKNNLSIHYEGLEAYPVSPEEIELLAYDQLGGITENRSIYHDLHNANWNEQVALSDSFHLLKNQVFLADFDGTPNSVDLIYFDAFGPRVQPELWEKPIFEKFFGVMKTNGVFVTYCAKGQVRRDLIAAGFQVEKIPGPPGKREMLRATKPVFEPLKR